MLDKLSDLGFVVSKTTGHPTKYVNGLYMSYTLNAVNGLHSLTFGRNVRHWSDLTIRKYKTVSGLVRAIEKLSA